MNGSNGGDGVSYGTSQYEVDQKFVQAVFSAAAEDPEQQQQAQPSQLPVLEFSSSSDYVPPAVPDSNVGSTQPYVLQFQESTVDQSTIDDRNRQQDRMRSSTAPLNQSQQEGLGQGAGQSQQPRKQNILLKPIQPYFDVNTQAVLARLWMAVVMPCTSSFYHHTAESPDLYGPFWLVTSMVFLSSATGNYADYLKHLSIKTTADSENQEWNYAIGKVSQSAILFYGYWLLAAFILWGVLKWHKSQVQLVHLWCIYGYSMAYYVPVVLLIIIPVTYFQWGLLLAATIFSGMFIVVNTREPMSDNIQGPIYLGTLLLMVVAHLAVAIAFKVLFIPT